MSSSKSSQDDRDEPAHAEIPGSGPPQDRPRVILPRAVQPVAEAIRCRPDGSGAVGEGLHFAEGSQAVSAQRPPSLDPLEHASDQLHAPPDRPVMRGPADASNAHQEPPRTAAIGASTSGSSAKLRDLPLSPAWRLPNLYSLHAIPRQGSSACISVSSVSWISLRLRAGNDQGPPTCPARSVV